MQTFQSLIGKLEASKTLSVCMYIGGFQSLIGKLEAFLLYGIPGMPIFVSIPHRKTRSPDLRERLRGADTVSIPHRKTRSGAAAALGGDQPGFQSLIGKLEAEVFC